MLFVDKWVTVSFYSASTKVVSYLVVAGLVPCETAAVSAQVMCTPFNHTHTQTRTHTHTHSLQKQNKMKRTPKHPLFFLLHGKYINGKEFLPEKATVKKGLWKMVPHYGSLATLTCFIYKGFNEIQIQKVTGLSSKKDWCTQSILYAGSCPFLHTFFLVCFVLHILLFQSRSSILKCLKSQLLVSFISTLWPKKAKQIAFICFLSP